LGCRGIEGRVSGLLQKGSGLDRQRRHRDRLLGRHLRDLLRGLLLELLLKLLLTGFGLLLGLLLGECRLLLGLLLRLLLRECGLLLRLGCRLLLAVLLCPQRGFCGRAGLSCFACGVAKGSARGKCLPGSRSCHGLRRRGLCRHGLRYRRLHCSGLYGRATGDVLGPAFTAPPAQLVRVIRVGVPTRCGRTASA
jgi:hypothetical protein